MRSVIKATATETKYPKLVQHEASGNVYLFTAPCVGTLLGRGERAQEMQRVGEHSKGWVAGMEDFHGTVTLSND